MVELTKRAVLAGIAGLPLFTTMACGSAPARRGALKLGINVSPINYYSSCPFIDRMKTSTDWTAQGLPLGTTPSEKFTDDLGCPTHLPAGAKMIATYVSLEATQDKPQLYELTFDGELTAQLLFATIVKSEPGRITFSYTGKGLFATVIIRSITRPPQFLRLAQVEEAALLAQGEIFRPSFLSKLKGFSTIRFMDWMRTNGSAFTDTFPAADVFSYAKCVPLEIMLALCKQVGARGWFNVPHLASAQLIDAMIGQIKGTGHHHILEPSNEVWNRGFAQAKYAIAHGDGDGTGRRWYGVFAARVAIAARGSGLKVVLGWQTVTPERSTAVWNAVYATGARDADFGGWIIAAYINGTLTASTGPMLDLAAHGDIDGALDNIQHSTAVGSTSVDVMARIYQAQGDIARAHRLPLMAYEGNFHLNAIPYFASQQNLVVPFVSAIQMDPRAALVMRANLDAFEAAGGEEAVLYNLETPASGGGFFGLYGTGSWSEVQRRITISQEPGIEILR